MARNDADERPERKRSPVAVAGAPNARQLEPMFAVESVGPFVERQVVFTREGSESYTAMSAPAFKNQNRYPWISTTVQLSSALNDQGAVLG